MEVMASSCCCGHKEGYMAGTHNVVHPSAIQHRECRRKERLPRDPQHVPSSLCIHNWWTPGAANKGATSTSEYGLAHSNSASGLLHSSIFLEGSDSRDGKGLLLSNHVDLPLAQKRHDSVETYQTLFLNEGSNYYMSTDAIFMKLQQCIDQTDLATGRAIHRLSINLGLDSDAFLGSHLIRMLAHFNCLSEAKQVFFRLPDPSVYSWNAIILAHVKLGQNQAALQLYHELTNACFELDGHIFVSALKTCVNLADLEQGMLMHVQVIEYGIEFDDYVGSGVVEMYAKCGDLENALLFFSRMPHWRAITCSLLIGGYINEGQEEIALELFREIVQHGVQLDEVSYTSVLKACSNISDLQQGRQIHAFLIENGLASNVCVGNALINFYIKCQMLQEAHAVFHRLPVHDVVTWTTLVSGYAQQGSSQKALQLFEAMEQHGMAPTSVTLVLILRACSSVSGLEQGRKVHARIVECGMELDEFAGSSLIDMYGKCGSSVEAGMMFERLPRQDVVSWSAFIGGCAENGQSSKAFLLFEQMQQQGVSPDKITFVCILKACSSPAYLDYGRQIHRQANECGFGTDMFLGNTLIDMYVKCQSLEDARRLSNRLPEQNLVTYSLLIGGYIQQGFALEAIQIFDKMSQEQVELDEMSFVCALKACSSIAALKQGRQIHGRAIQKGFELDAFVSSTLIDMYAKCGSLEDAYRGFERFSKQNVVNWSALMSGYAQNGDYMSVLRYFEGMQHEGLEPDDVSFLSLLAACSHRGLLEKGCTHFKAMRDEHGIEPTIKHHNSMVDMLGHAGCLIEAEDLLETIPFQPNLVGWTSLLTSCRRHVDVSVGRRSFDRFSMMERGNAIGYVLMGNIYSQLGMWEDAEEIERLRMCANGWKKPGKAFIEIDDQVHHFVVGDRTHPKSSAIYAKLESLSTQMKEEGYKPRVDLVLDAVSDDDKEDALCGHCEKLAIAFGLISTVQGATIRVSKNLRMCADCHTATKMISKLEMREIVVVDTYCTHHFLDGACSCPEYI